MFTGPTVPTPISAGQRILSLDVLRGFAVLGILVMNIQSFAMIESAYLNPNAFGDVTGLNSWVWFLSHLLADQKFMTIFSMLFGAGIVLMSERTERTGRRSTALHYRRMGWLIAIGLLHAYLLWYGDILFTYGICGLVVWWFARFKPLPLIVLGVCAVGVSSVLALSIGLTIPMWPAESLAEIMAEWNPSSGAAAAEIAIYRGSWMEQMSHRAPAAAMFQTFLLMLYLGWRAGGCMLIGMALYKLGVLSAARSHRFYLTLIAVAATIGIPVILYGVWFNTSHGWDVKYSMFQGMQFNYWASLLVALGWIGVIMLCCKSGAADWITRLFSPVGRMALTNYLLETVICTTIFYGHGLGLFGRLNRIEQLGVVLGVWTILMIISPLWLRRFRFGPAEWLWRTLTYGRFQPMLIKGEK